MNLLQLDSATLVIQNHNQIFNIMGLILYYIAIEKSCMVLTDNTITASRTDFQLRIHI